MVFSLRSIGFGLALLSTASASAQTPPSAAPIPVAPAAATSAQCELHVYPTHNYIGFSSGLLLGFGLVGGALEAAAQPGRIKPIKELMADYIGPDVQMSELNAIGLNSTLGLSNYKIIVEEPTPSSDEAKSNPEIKAYVKVLNAKLKSGERLSSSTNPCYAELAVTMLFYHKAAMYGSNLFTGFIFRKYDEKTGKPVMSNGAVKNPLEDFPPKSQEKVAAAKAELRDAFSKNFVEWSQKS